MMNKETLLFVLKHQDADVRTLALQAKRYPDVDMQEAIVQIAGRQIARRKVASWAASDEIRYPRHLSMEQCSSEQTARMKANIISQIKVSHHTLTDLTGGFGIDCAFLSSLFDKVDYVERQEELCQLAKHNFPALGLHHIEVHHADSKEYLNQMQPVDWIFLDPARRDDKGGKTVQIADCEPNVVELEELLMKKATHVLVKLSPMLDLSLAISQLKHVQAAYIISTNNECKELLLLLHRDVTNETSVHCINDEQMFTFTRRQEQEASCDLTSQVGVYLYEPNVSLLKAGAYKSIASVYGLKKLHSNSHLYTADSKVTNFPGRTFQVQKVAGFGKKDIKNLLADVKKANLTIRNFPSSVAELRKRLKLSEGGDVYIFATTLANEDKVLIRTQKI